MQGWPWVGVQERSALRLSTLCPQLGMSQPRISATRPNGDALERHLRQRREVKCREGSGGAVARGVPAPDTHLGATRGHAAGGSAAWRKSVRGGGCRGSLLPQAAHVAAHAAQQVGVEAGGAQVAWVHPCWRV